jgi:3-hydroxyacyl-CoA dehydrogenase
MWYADTAGLAKVLGRIREFEQRHGELWAPATLLVQLTEQGKSFADFDKKSKE